MSDETQNVQDDALDILNIFNEESSSTGLEAGVHERVKLISVDPERRKDNNGNLIKKQLFLKFKKFNKDGTDVGEKEISFFLIDPARDSAISNLHLFLAQTTELLSLFLTEEEIEEGFDPLKVLFDKDNHDEEDYTFDLIKKKVLKKASQFNELEEAICNQFYTLIEDKVGFDSTSFRLRLEESKDAKYIQIPRFDRFVEKAGIKKEDSVLYINAKK